MSTKYIFHLNKHVAFCPLHFQLQVLVHLLAPQVKHSLHTFHQEIHQFRLLEAEFVRISGVPQMRGSH